MTIYAAATGATPYGGAWVSDVDGLLPGWIDQGSYKLTEDGVERRVEAASGDSVVSVETDRVKIGRTNPGEANAQIQALLDDADTIFELAPGEHEITGLVYSDGKTIRGAGKDRTIVKLAAAAGNSVIGGSLATGIGTSANPIDDLTLEDLTLDGNRDNQTSGPAVFHAYASRRLKMNRVRLVNGKSYCFGLQGLPYEADVAKQGPHEDTVLHDVACERGDAGGLDVKSCDGFRATALSAEDNDDIGLDIRGRGIKLIMPRAINNAQAGIACRSHGDGPLDCSAEIFLPYTRDNVTGIQLGSSGSAGRFRTFHLTVVGGEHHDNSTDALVVATITDPANTEIHLNVLGGQYHDNDAEGMELTFYTSLTLGGGHVLDNLGHGINLMSSSPTCLLDGMTVKGHNQAGKTGIRAAGTPVRVRINGPLVTGNTTNITSHAGMVVLDAQTDTSSTVASTAALTLPVAHDFVTVSGTADITSIAASYAGRRVTLMFSGTAATNGIVDGSNLKLAGNLAYTPNDTLTLACDGTDWYEVGRAVN